MADQNLNLVAIGATGVGKSSFLNYLLDKDAFETSLSKPSTGKGFWHREAKIRGFPVHLIDTWGLEAGNSDEWVKLLKDELAKRSETNDISQGFHAICYAISATSNRVQDFDLKIIGFLVDEGYSVIVVLTKAAKASDEVIEAMTQEITNQFGDQIPVVAVNSVEETIRGHRFERFGSTEVEGYILLSFWQTIQQQMPRAIVRQLLKDVENRWDNVIFKKINGECVDWTSSAWNLMDAEGCRQKMTDEAESLKRHIRDRSIELRKVEVNRARKMYRSLAECMEKQGTEWNLPANSQILDAKFEAYVSNPSFVAQVAHIVTFTLYDPTVDIRRSLKNAAENFSKSIKEQINNDVLKQLVGRIGRISIDRSKLSERKLPMKSRFAKGIKKLFGIGYDA
jgi:GTP-binding protein EngB required for normal cell division